MAGTGSKCFVVVCLLYASSLQLTPPTDPPTTTKISDPFEVVFYMKNSLWHDNWKPGNQYAMMMIVPRGQKVQRLENVGANYKTQVFDDIHSDVMKHGDQFVIRSEPFKIDGSNRMQHSEKSVFEVIQKRNDVKQVLARGADVYFFSTNTPCDYCTKRITAYVKGEQQTLLGKLVTLPRPVQMFVAYDKVYTDWNKVEQIKKAA